MIIPTKNEGILEISDLLVCMNNNVKNYAKPMKNVCRWRSILVLSGRVDRFLSLKIWNSRFRCRLVSQTMPRSFFLLGNCHQDPHRTVLALFTHTALHMAIHRDSYILTIIRGSGRGNSSSILLNFCQLRHPLFPRRFSHLNRRFLASCANLPIPRALSVTP